MTQHDGMDHNSFRVVETADLPSDETTDGGAMAVDPGERKAVIRYRTPQSRVKLHALGMNDELDAEYQLHIDGEISASTESPLGTINDPFSFGDVYGRAVSAKSDIEYMVINHGDATLEFAGRMFLREVELPEDREPAPKGLGRYNPARDER